jgi:hypothetical protein
MKITNYLIIFLLAFMPLIVWAEDGVQSKAAAGLTSIDSKEFAGFDKCRISDQLSSTLSRLITETEPVKKEETSWTFAVTGEVMGLPIKAIEIGVCDSKGSRDCGWGSYLAVTIGKPFNDAKRHLKKRTGIDFSVEKRDAEYEVTLRAVLAVSKKDGETVLFCDPGTL